MARTCGSRSRTTARASRPTPRPTSSSSSARAFRRTRTRAAAWGSVSTWSSGSPSSTAATSGSIAERARARRSGSASRSAPSRTRRASRRTVSPPDAGRSREHAAARHTGAVPAADPPSHLPAPSVSGTGSPPKAGPTPSPGAATAGLDRATLERVRARDPEALGMFYDRYMDLVYGLAARMLGNRTLAEDATSEVFLKVHRAADRLDLARDPAPWLVTITTNVCRDLWRSAAYRVSRRAADVHDPLVAASLSSGRDEPEQDAVRSEREHAVQEALLQL